MEKEKKMIIKKGEILTDANRKQYIIGERLGTGGQAQVRRVRLSSTGEEFACKIYKEDPTGIQKNIEQLINLGPLKDKDGNVLTEVVSPKILVTQDGKEGFGYIMDLVDLDDYATIPQAWSNPAKCPSAKAMCRIIQNLARVFEAIHRSYGMCYKDINEGNIYFNPKTGDIKVIDNDNIGIKDTKSILGTPGYRAPEVVLGDLPDNCSDRFSLAVFAYRLLCGGYPFDGPFTDHYCESHGQGIDTGAERVVYGSEAVFTWHPTDKRNSIALRSDVRSKGQTQYWMNLPKEIKELFISTFVTHLAKDKREGRPDNEDWIETFRRIEQTLIKCPHCGAVTFSDSGRCFECEGDLGTDVAYRHHALFNILRAGEASLKLKVQPGDVYTVGKLMKGMPDDRIFRILYNKKYDMIGISNLSTLTWTAIYGDGKRQKVVPGKTVQLKKAMRIAVMPRTLQINVVDAK